MKNTLSKQLGLTMTLMGIFFVACLVWASVAQAQTQTATFALSWIDNSSGMNQEDGFRIERGTLPTGPFSALATMAAGVNKYSDVIPNDPGGQQRCYRVQAFNTAGSSGWSNVACGTSPAIIVTPPAPSGVTVTVTITVVVP